MEAQSWSKQWLFIVSPAEALVIERKSSFLKRVFNLWTRMYAPIRQR